MDRSIGNVNRAFNQYGIILADSSIRTISCSLASIYIGLKTNVGTFFDKKTGQFPSQCQKQHLFQLLAYHHLRIDNENNNIVSLEDLPILSCLFCSTYKTKIKFDMELHLFEKHKQDLVYNLPIHKTSMDDRIDYALDLIEQGLVVNAEPYQSNYAD